MSYDSFLIVRFDLCFNHFTCCSSVNRSATMYRTLQLLSSINASIDGLTSSTRCSSDTSDAIDTHASTASRRTESCEGITWLVN